MQLHGQPGGRRREGQRDGREDDHDAADEVSATLVKAFAERSRAMGHPLAVRETALANEMLTGAVPEYLWIVP